MDSARFVDVVSRYLVVFHNFHHGWLAGLLVVFDSRGVSRSSILGRRLLTRPQSSGSDHLALLSSNG